MSGQTGAQYVMMETHYNNEKSGAGLLGCRYILMILTQFPGSVFQIMWTALVYESTTLLLNGSTTEQSCNLVMLSVKAIISSCHLEKTTS